MRANKILYNVPSTNKLKKIVKRFIEAPTEEEKVRIRLKYGISKIRMGRLSRKAMDQKQSEIQDKAQQQKEEDKQEENQQE